MANARGRNQETARLNFCADGKVGDRLYACGFVEKLLTYMDVKIDLPTGYPIPNPNRDIGWLEIISLVRLHAPIIERQIMDAWDIILDKCSGLGETVEREIKRASLRRNRDDIKPQIVKGINHALRRHAAIAMIRQFETVVPEENLNQQNMRQLFALLPMAIQDNIESFTCELRSIVMPVSMSMEDLHKVETTNNPMQTVLEMMSRRWAMVIGAGYQALMKQNGQLTRSHAKRHGKLRLWFDKPRERYVRGVLLRNLGEDNAELIRLANGLVEETSRFTRMLTGITKRRKGDKLLGLGKDRTS